jgi:hypothetical protein
VRCVAFAELEDEVRRACRADATWRPPPQVDYLRDYLCRGLRTQTLLIEENHVDRHYLEEYGGYYSTKLRPPLPRTVRIHFFEKAFGATDLDAWIEEARTAGRVTLLEEHLGPQYIGFSTIRPIPDAPIGRTVLRPYDGKPSRCYRPAAVDTRVHLLGATLSVRGLPFQQQEQAVGACATTALWCALASAARATGQRAPTPFSITVAAKRHFIEGRTFPAIEGLAVSHLSAAIREAGFSPYRIRPGADPQSFLLSVKTYVASGIPAILVVAHDKLDDGHAMTVCGFREDDLDYPAPDLGVTIGPITLKSRGLTRLYIHDDREGPYVRMAIAIDADSVKVARVPYGTSSVQPPLESVWYALFPLYPKLRLTARELVTIAAQEGSFVRFALGERAAECRVETYFRLNGDYLSELYGLEIDAARLARFVKAARFSRYVGVIRYLVGDALIADLVVDTTDIARAHPSGAEILAVLPFAPDLRLRLDEYAARSFPHALVL